MWQCPSLSLCKDEDCSSFLHLFSTDCDKVASLSCSHLWWTGMFYREFSTYYLRLNAFGCKCIPTVYFSKITAQVPQSSAMGCLNEDRLSSLLTACQHVPEAWQEIDRLRTQPWAGPRADWWPVERRAGGSGEVWQGKQINAQWQQALKDLKSHDVWM